MWDWDVIPYLALAFHAQGLDWPAAHAAVYAWVAALPEPWSTDLLTRDVYRASVAADAESLRQVGGFYQARVGYYGLLAALEYVGVTPAIAVQGINLVGQVVLGGTIWAWLRPYVRGVWWQVGLWMLLYAVLLFNPTVMKLARWSSPDGLVAALYVLGMYGVVRHRSPWAAAAWLVMVLLRPNTALWLAPVAMWAWWQARYMMWPLLGVGMVAVAIQWLFPNYPLSVVWQHTFGFPYTHPAEVHLAWTHDVYMATFKNRIGLLHGRDAVVWGLMAACTGLMWATQAPVRWLATAVMAGACLQLAVFPAFWERYFGGIAICLVLMALSALIKPKPYRAEP